MNSKDIILNEKAVSMENMEIDIEAIDDTLMPELPESVAKFVSMIPDKPY